MSYAIMRAGHVRGVETMHRLIGACLAILCLALAGCSGNSPMASAGDCEGVISGEGEFELAVTGSGTADECGLAVSAESAANGNWGVQLLSTSGISQINVWTDAGGRPTIGTYTVVDYVATTGSPAAGSFVVLAIFDEATLGKTLTSVNGTLTIESSSADEVRGTFAFSAREGTGSAAAAYNVSGSFIAANTDA